MTVLDRIPEERRWRWTGEAAERAMAAGILPEGGRWEIVDGQLIEKMPQGSLHASFVAFLIEALSTVFREEDVHLHANAPIFLEVGEEPEPDIAVVRGRARGRIGTKPSVEDILRVIEVSVTSGSADTGSKLKKYARFGISEYWIFDLRERTLTVHQEPAGETYLVRTTYRPNAPLPLLGESLDEILGAVRP